MSHEDTAPVIPPEEADDTEGHAFKWQIEDDGKGGKKLRQAWDPNDGPPGAKRTSSTSDPKKGR